MGKIINLLGNRVGVSSWFFLYWQCVGHDLNHLEQSGVGTVYNDAIMLHS